MNVPSVEYSRMWHLS